VDTDGAVVFRQACVMGLEGIVAKRRDSRYRSGRCREWIKVKNRAHPAFERAVLIALSKPAGSGYGNDPQIRRPDRRVANTQIQTYCREREGAQTLLQLSRVR
jgi:hypothetical protein